MKPLIIKKPLGNYPYTCSICKSDKLPELDYIRSSDDKTLCIECWKLTNGYKHYAVVTYENGVTETYES